MSKRKILDTFEDFELLWLEEADIPFKEVGSYNTSNARIKHGEWGRIASGYKIAGDILTDYVLNYERKQNFLIFPIAFNYRHSLELLMKRIIEIGIYLYPEICNSKEIGKKVPTHHKIENLWDTVRKIVIKHENMQEEDSTLKAMKKVINQLSKFDPVSVNFRYPIDNKGETHNFPLDIVNIEIMSKVMRKAYNLLDAIDMSLSVALELKNEMESEYNNYF